MSPAAAAASTWLVGCCSFYSERPDELAALIDAACSEHIETTSGSLSCLQDSSYSIFSDLFITIYITNLSYLASRSPEQPQEKNIDLFLSGSLL